MKQTKTYYNFVADIERRLGEFCKADIVMHEHDNNMFFDFKLNCKIVYRYVIYNLFNKWVCGNSSKELADTIVCNYFDYIYSQHFKKIV